MNRDAINTTIQVIGVLAVVGTLIYLAAQVRQGNVFTKLQARQRMIEQQDSELYAQMADPSITDASVKDGVLDEGSYQTYHEVIAIHLGTPRTRKWWQVLGRHAFDAEFVEQVDQLLAASEPSSYLRAMRTWDDA